MHIARLTSALLAPALGSVVLGALARPVVACHDPTALCVRPVPTRPAGGHAAGAHGTTADPASGLDWDSAGIGAGAVLGAFAIGLAGVAVVRRRGITGIAPIDR